MKTALYFTEGAGVFEQAARWSCDCGVGNRRWGAPHTAAEQAVAHVRAHQHHGAHAQLVIREWVAPRR